MLPTLDEIYEDFGDDILSDLDVVMLLEEIGAKMPPFPEAMCVPAHKVVGCQSQVWLTADLLGTGKDAPFKIRAFSDARIVRGLLAILIAALDGKTAEEILQYDIEGVFRRLTIEKYVGVQRRNGLAAMIARLRLLAMTHLTALGEPSGQRVGSRTLPNQVQSSSPVLKPFDEVALRRQFPVLNRPLASGQLPVYLDSGASAQKPQVVIDKEREVEEQYFANAHRGTYQFGLRIDEEFEGARMAIARFLNAGSESSIVFTPGTTVGLNMIAFGWGRRHVQPGDEILTTVMEHHANFVPWQQLAKERGATLRLIPLTEDGRLDLGRLDEVLNSRTKVVAVTAMSNMLGTVNPVAEIVRRAHKVGACVVIDGAQSVPHTTTDLQALDADFLVFSGHKLYGPTGVGVLYGKPERLEEMAPIIFGGHMISEVRIENSTWSPAPAKFEAGTMPIVQAIALGEAVRWVQNVGLDAIHQHEQTLLKSTMERLTAVPGMTIYGPALEHRGGIVSFRIDGVHPEDLAALLDQKDVFTRHGHHCTMPLHTHLGVSATTRVSLAAYNTQSDIEQLMQAIEFARRTLKKS